MATRPRVRTAPLLLIPAALALLASRAVAQRAGDALSGVTSSAPAAVTPASHAMQASRITAAVVPAIPRPNLGGTWWTPIASAVLPGTGQLALKQERALPYLAAEAFAWLRYATDQREAKRQRRAYRELARDVARRTTVGARPEGDWDYYERMEHFASSGAYDRSAGGRLDPETDTTTYNGAVWQLARETYWESPDTPPEPGSPEYYAAEEFYERRAIGEAFRWSWVGAELERDMFRQTIARSNDAYRRAAVDLAAIIANHALSSVDAYVTLRLRRRRAMAPGGVGEGFEASVSVPFGAAPRR